MFATSGFGPTFIADNNTSLGNLYAYSPAVFIINELIKDLPFPPVPVAIKQFSICNPHNPVDKIDK